MNYFSVHPYELSHNLTQIFVESILSNSNPFFDINLKINRETQKFEFQVNIRQDIIQTIFLYTYLNFIYIEKNLIFPNIHRLQYRNEQL